MSYVIPVHALPRVALYVHSRAKKLSQVLIQALSVQVTGAGADMELPRTLSTCYEMILDVAAASASSIWSILRSLNTTMEINQLTMKIPMI